MKALQSFDARDGRPGLLQIVIARFQRSERGPRVIISRCSNRLRPERRVDAGYGDAHPNAQRRIVRRALENRASGLVD